MKNCGRRFHNEVAKYRFLNELIKVVSPKVSSVPVAYSQSEQVPTVLLTPTFCFSVYGRQRAREGKAEDCGDAVQLDSGFSGRDQDQRSLPDAQEAGCVEIPGAVSVE